MNVDICRGVLREDQASKPTFAPNTLAVTAIFSGRPLAPVLASSRERKASLIPLTRLLFVRESAEVSSLVTYQP